MMKGDSFLDEIEKMVEPHRGIWDDPFRILITGIMSTRTKDEVTDRASLKLFCRFPDMYSLSRSSPAEIEKLIKPVGFYRTKAVNILKCTDMIINDFNGNVPDEMDELVRLPGVGRKVANIVLSYGIGKDALAVDTHVQRVSFRLGLTHSEKPEVTERVLKKIISRKRWNEVNSYFVAFGKQICRPVRPRCNICSLRVRCRYWRENEGSN
jgi:endonuclease-3